MTSGRRPLLVAVRAVLAVAALTCLAGPWLFDANSLSVLTEFFIVLTLALMWNLLAGYADIISVGQQGFVGVGAYAFFGFTALAHLNVWLAIPLAALTTLIVAVPVMAVIFRLRTAYLAVGTWVASDVLMLVAGKLPGFGGGSGTSLPIPVVKQFGVRLGDRIDIFYTMSLGLALTAFVATWALLRSRIGLGLTAMRDNEEAAGSAGVDLVKTRVICFLWTAPFLGLAGVMTALEKLRVAPSASFNIADWTIDIIFIVVIGGIGSLEGPIIGAIVFFVLRQQLADFGAWYLILLGIISIVIILFEPRGVWGAFRRWGVPDLLPVSYGPLTREPQNGSLPEKAGGWARWRTAHRAGASVDPRTTRSAVDAGRARAPRGARSLDLFRPLHQARRPADAPLSDRAPDG
jgi:branched-chain amino acid transport system permease protein